MKIRNNFLSIFIINSSFYLIFFIGTEFILGNWIKNFFTLKGYIPIPGLIKDRVLMYDARKIFSSSKPVPIIYTRDELGYRSRNLNKNKPQILTIGGSSTDQRYTTDGKTWQDNLDIIAPRYDFINGGVDGQSSYGHLDSIKLWHSKNLNPENVSKIIFYIGVNESRFLKNYKSELDVAKTPTQYLKGVLRDNSFYAIKTKKIIQKFKNKYTALEEPSVFINQHKARPIDFLDKGIFYKLENFNSELFPEYVEIFTNLLIETRNTFPKSKVIVIQQQLPGCSFINQFEVNDRYPDIETRCLDLIKIFELQKKVVQSQNFRDEIKLVPMYLEKILNDDDVYDYTHTNNVGSMKVAKFIKSIL